MQPMFLAVTREYWKNKLIFTVCFQFFLVTLLFDVISYIETDSSGLPSCFLKPKPNYNKNLDEKFYLLLPFYCFNPELLGLIYST